MIVEAVFFGIILGYLKRGNLKNLNQVKIKGIYFAVTVLILDFILRIFILNVKSEISNRLFYIYPYVNLFIYFIFIAFLEFNRETKFFRIIESGFLLNFLPMFLNRGKMPVSSEAMMKIGKSSEIFLLENNLLLGHSLLNENTRFKILSDIIPFKIFIPKVISIGDIVITIGIVLFISHYMSDTKS